MGGQGDLDQFPALGLERHLPAEKQNRKLTGRNLGSML